MVVVDFFVDYKFLKVILAVLAVISYHRNSLELPGFKHLIIPVKTIQNPILLPKYFLGKTFDIPGLLALKGDVP